MVSRQCTDADPADAGVPYLALFDAGVWP